MPGNTALSRLLTYRRILRPALFLTGMLFFIALIIRSWDEMQCILEILHWPLFLFSTLIALVDNVLFSLLFQDLLAKYGLSLDYPRVGQMYFYGQMAKYIPGRIWCLIYQSAFLQKPGSTSAIAFANVDLISIIILRNVAIALALMFFYERIWLTGIVFILGSVGFWYLSKSLWISHFLRYAASMLRLIANNSSTCVPNLINIRILLFGVLCWITFLTSNFLMLKAAFGATSEQAAIYIANFSLAWVIGVISFIMPAGIGIREISFIILAQNISLGEVSKIETLAAIAIVYRVWHTLLDLGGLGVGFMLSRESQGGSGYPWI